MENKELFSFSDKNPDVVIKPTTKHVSSFKNGLIYFTKNKLAMSALGLFILIFISSIIISSFSVDPLLTDSNNIFADPSSEHIFGTDEFGRDLWSRVWNAIWISLTLALITSIINVIIATLVGVITGYFEKVDNVSAYLIKILHSLPVILVLILFSVIFGASFQIVILSLVITGWVAASQQIRAQTLRVKNSDFIIASQTLGTRKVKILSTFFTLAIPTIIIQFAIIFPRMILAEATLGFLGLSVPDVPTLGNLINSGRNVMTLYPMQVFIPMIYLVVVIVCIQLIAFGVESAFGVGRKKN